jgi:hypothetical protein
MSSDTRSRLLTAIAKARRWLDELTSGRAPDVDTLATREDRSPRSVSMLLSLAFLAPDLVKAIVENRLPRGIGLTRIWTCRANGMSSIACWGFGRYRGRRHASLLRQEATKSASAERKPQLASGRQGSSARTIQRDISAKP